MTLSDTNVLLLVHAGFDLSGATFLALTIDKPGNLGTVVVSSPTIGTQYRAYPLVTLAPHTYVEYQIQPSDVPVVGQYLCHIKYKGPVLGQTVTHSSFLVAS